MDRKKHVGYHNNDLYLLIEYKERSVNDCTLQ